MNTDQAALAFGETEAEGQTLFDELAGLGASRDDGLSITESSHTRAPSAQTMRCFAILEAMGILALLTREMPAEIAAEREVVAKDSGKFSVPGHCSREANGRIHITTRITPCSVAEGIGRRFGPASNCEAVWARACDSVSSNPVCRIPPECLASPVLR